MKLQPEKVIDADLGSTRANKKKRRHAIEHDNSMRNHSISKQISRQNKAEGQRVRKNFGKKK